MLTHDRSRHIATVQLIKQSDGPLPEKTLCTFHHVGLQHASAISTADNVHR